MTMFNSFMVKQAQLEQKVKPTWWVHAKVICTRKPVQNILSEEILKFGDAKLVVVLIFLAMQWPTLKLEKKLAIGCAVVLGGHTAINCLMDL